MAILFKINIVVHGHNFINGILLVPPFGVISNVNFFPIRERNTDCISIGKLTEAKMIPLYRKILIMSGQNMEQK